MNKDDCIFCKIANGEIPSATVYEDSVCRVILDVNPANKGHALIIPKEHFDDIYSKRPSTLWYLCYKAIVAIYCVYKKKETQKNAQKAKKRLNTYYIDEEEDF